MLLPLHNNLQPQPRGDVSSFKNLKEAIKKEKVKTWSKVKTGNAYQ